MLVALIMAGGSGQRFWPLSNEEHPKQLLKLFSDKTMIRETVERILPLIPSERIFIATNIKQEQDIKKELIFIPDENVIIEPEFKDTAACIGYAATKIKNKMGDVNMIVLPSDHLISKKNDFLRLIKQGNEIVNEDGKIAIFGIEPDKPETGYGYIEFEKNEESNRKKVLNFKEKPNVEVAKEYLESGNYYWNSGMFMWSTKTILGKIEKYMDGHWKILEEIKEAFGKEDEKKRIKEAFDKFEKISIDYGIMENAKGVEVLGADIGWNDIGTFTSLDDVFLHDGNGSVIRDDEGAEVVEYHSHDNIIINNGHKKIIATMGIEDTVIVETDDVLLVCKKSEAQGIKELLKKVKS